MKISISPSKPEPRLLTVGTIPAGRVAVLASSEAGSSLSTVYYIGIGGSTRIRIADFMPEGITVQSGGDASPVRLLEPGESFTVTVTA